MRKCTYLKRNAFRDSVLCDLKAIAFHECEDNITTPVPKIPILNICTLETGISFKTT